MKLVWSIVAATGLFIVIVVATAQAAAFGAPGSPTLPTATPTPYPDEMPPNDLPTPSAPVTDATLLPRGSFAASSAALPSCTGLDIVWSSITTTNPTQAGRLFRDANPTLCSTRKNYPGLNDSNPHHYATHWFTNTTGADRCYKVDVIQSCPDTNMLFFSTYLNSYNPADLSTNYLADIGSSPIPTGRYSFTVPAGMNFGIVVNEVTQDAGCSSYIFTLSDCPCWNTSVTGSITNTDSSQTDRLFRDGVASTCPVSKTFPGPYGSSDTIHYDKYDFTNTTSGTACYKVDVTAPSCTVNNMIFVSAYQGAYNPANPASNYLADMGSSPTPSGSFSFKVPPGQPYVLVVNEVTAGYGCSNYRLDITNCSSQVCLPAVLR